MEILEKSVLKKCIFTNYSFHLIQEKSSGMMRWVLEKFWEKITGEKISLNFELKIMKEN